MDIGRTILQGMRDRAHRISDERFWNIVSLLKSVCFILLLTILIIAWDTAPALAPVTNVTSDIRIHENASGKFLRIFESYNVVRPVKFTQTYTLVGNSMLHIRSVSGSYTVGPRTETIVVPYEDVQSGGRWCLKRTISWINGLSLRTHEMVLPENCFEVK